MLKQFNILENLYPYIFFIRYLLENILLKSCLKIFVSRLSSTLIIIGVSLCVPCLIFGKEISYFLQVMKK